MLKQSNLTTLAAALLCLLFTLNLQAQNKTEEVWDDIFIISPLQDGNVRFAFPMEVDIDFLWPASGETATVNVVNDPMNDTEKLKNGNIRYKDHGWYVDTHPNKDGSVKVLLNGNELFKMRKANDGNVSLALGSGSVIDIMSAQRTGEPVDIMGAQRIREPVDIMGDYSPQNPSQKNTTQWIIEYAPQKNGSVKVSMMANPDK